MSKPALARLTRRGFSAHRSLSIRAAKGRKAGTYTVWVIGRSGPRCCMVVATIKGSVRSCLAAPIAARFSGD